MGGLPSIVGLFVCSWVLAFNTPCLADGEDPFTYDHCESAISLGIQADPITGPNIPINVHLDPHIVTWDVYTDEQGNVDIRNSVQTDVTDGSLTWEVLSGTGTFLNPPASPNPQGGSVDAAFEMTSNCQIQVTLSRNGSIVSESTNLYFADLSTSWQMLRSVLV